MKFELKTHEDAYIYGYLWADGNINMSGHSCSIGIEVVDSLVVNILCKKFNIKVYNRQRHSETGNIKQVTHTFRKSNVELVESIIDLGFRSSTDKIPTELLPSFLVGFLDGDGCIYHNKNTFQLSFVSKIEEDWGWFHSAVSRLGLVRLNESIRSSKCKALSKTTYSSMLRTTSGKAMDFLNFIYSNHKGPRLDRKYRKFLSGLNYNIGSRRKRRV